MKVRSCFAILGLLAIPTAAMADEGVLSNSSLEQTGSCMSTWTSTPCPTGYNRYFPDPANTTVNLETLHDGKVVSTSLENPTGYTRAGFYRSILAPVVGDYYRFSVMVRTEKLKGQARIQITERNGSGLPGTPVEVEGPRGSSGWQKLSITRQASTGTAQIDFGVITSTNTSLCASGDCGKAYYDNFVVEHFPSGSAEAVLKNACPDGQFLKLTDRSCAPLDKSFGFSQAQFDLSAKNYILSSTCSTTDFLYQLNLIKVNSGGTLVLPAECTLSFTAPFEIPSNTIIQGAGSGRTMLYTDTWGSTVPAFVRVENTAASSRPGAENIIIRDLTIGSSSSLTPSVSGSATAVMNLAIASSSNVLVERVELAGGGRSNLNVRHGQGITVRYVNSYGASSSSASGIGAKDCFPTDLSSGETVTDDNPADGRFSKSECDRGESRYWSEDFAVYSNRIVGNGSGLDLHTLSTEVAGNVVSDNNWGSKFPEPAKDLWIHDNVFANSGQWGSSSVTQYCGAIDSTLQVANHVYYRNQYLNNGTGASQTFGWRVQRGKDVILVGNTYSGNGLSNKWRIDDSCTTPDLASTVSYCEGDGIASSTLEIVSTGSGPTLLGSTNAKCDLEDVSSIFD